ncbi:MAG: hypothetical protein AAGJ80_09235, partial [Cyanobacteria bacterium J06553_1]
RPTPTEEDLKLAQELMAQLQDPEQSLEDARIEDEFGGEVEAGYIKDHQLGKFLADPDGFCQYQRLKKIVFWGLRQLLIDCDLGAGLSAAYASGKQPLDERLQQPAIEIQQQLMALLDEDLSSSRDMPLSETAQTNLKQVIQTVLSDEDWETISAAAAQSLQQHLKAVVCLPQTA